MSVSSLVDVHKLNCYKIIQVQCENLRRSSKHNWHLKAVTTECHSFNGILSSGKCIAAKPNCGQKGCVVIIDRFFGNIFSQK